MTTATTTAALAIETEESCCAVLPYWPVWAAAQFATADEAKALLQFVHVWRDGDTLQIESTDGHRAFRYRFPASPIWRLPESGALLLAKPLRKAVSYAKVIMLSDSLRASFHGGKRDTLAEMSSVNLAGAYSVNSSQDFGKVGAYPRINQLWPDTFSNAPGYPWAFNASYLKDWCAVVEKLSPSNYIRTQGNAPTTPFVFQCDYEGGIGDHFDSPVLEMLLMPVQIRGDYINTQRQGPKLPGEN